MKRVMGSPAPSAQSVAGVIELRNASRAVEEVRIAPSRVRITSGSSTGRPASNYPEPSVDRSANNYPPKFCELWRLTPGETLDGDLKDVVIMRAAGPASALTEFVSICCWSPN